MSNIDWTHALELFNKETETLEGGGIIIYPNGSIEAAESHYGELSDSMYTEDDVCYYNGHPLYEIEFVENGFTYMPMEDAEVPTEGFLEYHANKYLENEQSAFLGATSISGDEDELVWLFIHKAE